MALDIARILHTMFSMQYGEPVKTRSNLNQELVGTLRDRILNGELAPGQRLNEVHLSKRFGVSRTPLREALIVLAYEGVSSLPAVFTRTGGDAW